MIFFGDLTSSEEIWWWVPRCLKLLYEGPNTRRTRDAGRNLGAREWHRKNDVENRSSSLEEAYIFRLPGWWPCQFIELIDSTICSKARRCAFSTQLRIEDYWQVLCKASFVSDYNAILSMLVDFRIIHELDRFCIRTQIQWYAGIRPLPTSQRFCPKTGTKREGERSYSGVSLYKAVATLTASRYTSGPWQHK